MLLMLDNLPADVTADDLLELFSELGIPAPTEISIAPGLRGRPSAVVSFELNHAEMEAIVSLLDERFWKSHTLQASHSAFFH